jgi:hypothetical protein
MTSIGRAVVWRPTRRSWRQRPRQQCWLRRSRRRRGARRRRDRTPQVRPRQDSPKASQHRSRAARQVSQSSQLRNAHRRHRRSSITSRVLLGRSGLRHRHKAQSADTRDLISVEVSDRSHSNFCEHFRVRPSANRATHVQALRLPDCSLKLQPGRPRHHPRRGLIATIASTFVRTLGNRRIGNGRKSQWCASFSSAR